MFMLLCLQETKLNPNLNLKIKGYAELWRDRTKKPWRRSGISDKAPTIKYTEVFYLTPDQQIAKQKHMQSYWTYLVIQLKY
ncbi:hypothetical protein TNCV_3482311 [Trichonephila clavipes]|nr:hypothetical protein TNCV_3482311 [Trichonephila clavipes]